MGRALTPHPTPATSIPPNPDKSVVPHLPSPSCPQFLPLVISPPPTFPLPFPLCPLGKRRDEWLRSSSPVPSRGLTYSSALHHKHVFSRVLPAPSPTQCSLSRLLPKLRMMVSPWAFGGRTKFLV